MNSEPKLRSGTAWCTHSLSHNARQPPAPQPAKDLCWQPRWQYVSRPRNAHQSKRRHSVDALDFSKDWVYDVPSFLRTLRLHKYIDVLDAQSVTFEALLNMSEEDLTNVGVATQGARKRMYLAILKYRKFMEEHNMAMPRPLSLSPLAANQTFQGLPSNEMPQCSARIASDVKVQVLADDGDSAEDEKASASVQDKREIAELNLELSLEEAGARLLKELLSADGS